MTITAQPTPFALFGTNPRWLQVESTGSQNTVRMTLSESDGSGGWTDSVRLYNYFRSDRATFNLSKLLNLDYDLPEKATIDAFDVKKAANFVKKYQAVAEEINAQNLVIDSAEVTAIAIRGGRDTVENRDYNFFADLATTRKFLSLQPQLIEVTQAQPEWLFYPILWDTDDNLWHTLRVKMEFSDDSVQTLPIYSSGTAAQFFSFTGSHGDVAIFPTGYSQLNLQQFETPDKYVMRYTVWVDTRYPDDPNVPSDGDLFRSEFVTYEVDFDLASWDYHYFLFSNPMGGMDTLCAKGKSVRTAKQKRQSRAVYETPETERHVHPQRALPTESQTELKVNVGWIENPEVMLWLEDCANSTDVWQIDVLNNQFVPVLTSSNSLIVNRDDDSLPSAEFIFQYPKRSLR